MSFVPTPQKANAAGNGTAAASGTPRGGSLGLSSAAVVSDSNNALPEEDSTFKARTFDVLWVDRTALMYKDGITKVRVCSFE